MSITGIIAFILIVAIWTVVRETLLEKYAYAKHPNAMRNSGLIVAWCFLITTIILLLLG